MSIMIKGIIIPKSCEECFLADYLHNVCRGTGFIIIRKKCEEKPKWCPIVEVPEDSIFLDAKVVADRFATLIEMKRKYEEELE